MKLVVFKARICDPGSKGYDVLTPAPGERGVDYVLFTNSPEGCEGKGWRVLPPVFKDLNHRRCARHHKILSHVLFPNAEATLWLDGVFALKHPPLKLVTQYLRDASVVTHKHPARTCIYQEAKAVIRRRKDKPVLVENQIARYRREKFPRGYGLAETGALLRRNSPEVRKLNELWWDEICKGSQRDQVSFDYCLWKLKMKRGVFCGWTKNSPHFAWKPHGSKK